MNDVVYKENWMGKKTSLTKKNLEKKKWCLKSIPITGLKTKEGEKVDLFNVGKKFTNC